jgi:hypothetical protein
MVLNRRTLDHQNHSPWANAIISVSFSELHVFKCQWLLSIWWSPWLQHWSLTADVSYISHAMAAKLDRTRSLVQFSERTATTIAGVVEQLQELVQEVIASRERIDAGAGTVRPPAE